MTATLDALGAPRRASRTTTPGEVIAHTLMTGAYAVGGAVSRTWQRVRSPLGTVLSFLSMWFGISLVVVGVWALGYGAYLGWTTADRFAAAAGPIPGSNEATAMAAGYAACSLIELESGSVSGATQRAALSGLNGSRVSIELATRITAAAAAELCPSYVVPGAAAQPVTPATRYPSVVAPAGR